MEKLIQAYIMYVCNRKQEKNNWGIPYIASSQLHDNLHVSIWSLVADMQLVPVAMCLDSILTAGIRARITRVVVPICIIDQTRVISVTVYTYITGKPTLIWNNVTDTSPWLIADFLGKYNIDLRLLQQ